MINMNNNNQIVVLQIRINNLQYKQKKLSESSDPNEQIKAKAYARKIEKLQKELKALQKNN